MDVQLAQLVLNGVAVGSVIALAAVGLTLTYGILRLSNFAHGDFMTLGSYLTLVVNSLGVNIWLSMLVAAGVTVGGILVTEWLIWAPLRSRRTDATTLVIVSIGLALLIRNGIILVWGGSNRRYDLPVPEAVQLLGLRIPQYDLVVIGLAIVAIATLHYLLQNTKIGKAMRAVADDLDLSRVSGIDVEQVILWTWVIAGVMTALGGSMLGLTEGIRPNMGWFLLLPMFSAVVLGGIGNPYGAIAGAFVIGIAQEVSTYFLPGEYKLGVALLLMVAVLLFRPQGLFKGTM